MSAAASTDAERGRDDALRLAELTCARICHDISGLLGTLAGALEMLGEEIGTSETAELATDAAREISQRLRLLRAAWGGGTDESDARRLADLAAGLPTARRVRSDFSGLGDAVLPAPVARLALCMVIVGAEALPGGGLVALSGGAHGLAATISGPRAAWPPALPAWATGTAAQPDGPRELAVPMLSLAATAAGMRLRPPATPDGTLVAETVTG